MSGSDDTTAPDYGVPRPLADVHPHSPGRRLLRQIYGDVMANQGLHSDLVGFVFSTIVRGVISASSTT